MLFSELPYQRVNMEDIAAQLESLPHQLESAGLDSPFDEGCMKAICEETERFIDSYDLDGIQ